MTTPHQVLRRHAAERGNDRHGAFVQTRNCLIADEPTTALDVTIQVQILVICWARIASRVSACRSSDDYARSGHHRRNGRRCGGDVRYRRSWNNVPVRELFANPLHPYTFGLFQSRPNPGRSKASRLNTIPGMVPSPLHFPAGCKFHPRCPFCHARGAPQKSRCCGRLSRVTGSIVILPASWI